jgi:hypothetical protein
MELTHRSHASSGTGEHWVCGTPTQLWPRERDFVDWLIANLDLLGASMGMILEFTGREVGIGPRWTDTDIFGREWLVGGRRLDIDARNEQGQRVIVEAQLGPTDHSHLGQLMSYAVLADAQHIVWAIAGDPIDSAFCDDHLDAVAELNEIYAGRRTFTVVEAVIESQRRPTPVYDDPLVPMLRRVDLTTMTYAPDPVLPAPS